MKNLSKKISSTALALLLIASAQPLTSIASANGAGVCGPGNFAGGDGSLQDPFLVQNQNALAELSDCGLLNYSYLQTQDIALSGLWHPISRFIGNYNGNGHAITGIDIDEATTSVGLFSSIETSVITDLTISGWVTNEGRETGLLAGSITDSVVNTITAYVNVYGVQDTGGVIGAAYTSTVSNVTVAPLDSNSKVQVTDYTGGGVLGFVLNSDVDMITNSVDVEGIAGASQLGGIYGAAIWTAGEEFTHTLLVSTGDVIALNNGSYRCGGLAGAGDFPIQFASVTDADIICEHLDIGGAVGNYSSSLSVVRVEANVEAREFDSADYEMQIGGLIGYWGLTSGQEITHSYFSGTLDGDFSLGGLVGLLQFSAAPDGVDITIDHSYAVGSFSESMGAGGLIGGTIASDDPLIHPNLTIEVAYSSMDFSIDSLENDSLARSNYDIQFENVLWNSTSQFARSIFYETVPGTTYVTMMRPLYWANRNFDFVSDWAMDKAINDSLPVLRGFFPEASHNALCVTKTFSPIFFAKNSAKLDAKAKKKIRSIATQIKNGNCLYIQMSGYTSGKEIKKGKKKLKYQISLSNRRATAVSEYLYDVLYSKGLPAGVGSGGNGAVGKKYKDKTKKQQAANRRVMISTLS